MFWPRLEHRTHFDTASRVDCCCGPALGGRGGQERGGIAAIRSRSCTECASPRVGIGTPCSSRYWRTTSASGTQLPRSFPAARGHPFFGASFTGSVQRQHLPPGVVGGPWAGTCVAHVFGGGAHDPQVGEGNGPPRLLPCSAWSKEHLESNMAQACPSFFPKLLAMLNVFCIAFPNLLDVLVPHLPGEGC